MKIKSIIVDDEKHGRENLAGILQQYCPDVDLQAKMLGGFEPLSTQIPGIYGSIKKKIILSLL
jgi:DNA-binding LytR/AlgR family response regulator